MRKYVPSDRRRLLGREADCFAGSDLYSLESQPLNQLLVGQDKPENFNLITLNSVCGPLSDLSCKHKFLIYI